MVLFSVCVCVCVWVCGLLNCVAYWFPTLYLTLFFKINTQAQIYKITQISYIILPRFGWYILPLRFLIFLAPSYFHLKKVFCSEYYKFNYTKIHCLAIFKIIIYKDKSTLYNVFQMLSCSSTEHVKKIQCNINEAKILQTIFCLKSFHTPKR